MKKFVTSRSFAGVALFGVGLLTGVVAQTSTNSSGGRVEQKRVDLSGAPGMEVIAALTELKPGESGDVHFHHGIEVAYVLQGATLQLASGETTKVPAGVTILNLRDVMHGSTGKVVGDSSLKLFTVHVVDKGKPLYDKK